MFKNLRENIILRFLSILILGIILGMYTLTAVIANNNTDPNSVVLEIRVATSNDDAEEQPDGRILLTSGSLELTYAESNQIIGQRFTEVNIPQGTSITNAYIQFTARERSSSKESLLIIQAEDTANALPFLRKNGNITSRPTTKTTISWKPEQWLARKEVSLAQRTPNIAPIIQEIIDRPDWSEGNALLILIKGEGKRVAKSFDSEPRMLVV